MRSADQIRRFKKREKERMVISGTFLLMTACIKVHYSKPEAGHHWPRTTHLWGSTNIQQQSLGNPDPQIIWSLYPSVMVTVWITGGWVAWVKREQPASLSTPQQEGHNLLSVVALTVSHFAIIMKWQWQKSHHHHHHLNHTSQHQSVGKPSSIPHCQWD